MADEKQFLDYDGLTEFKNSLNGVDIVTTAGDGANYTATVPGITALKAGLTLTLIPHTVSTAVLPKLNVNSLGAKAIRRRVSNSTVTTVASATANWLAANKPIRVTFDGTYWIADLDRPNATDLYGTVALANGGTGATTAESARANLGAVALTAVAVTLAADGWADNQQTVTVTGVTADEENCHVIPTPAPASRNAYAEAGICCSVQGDGTLTFTCESVPSEAITVNVAVFT